MSIFGRGKHPPNLPSAHTHGENLTVTGVAPGVPITTALRVDDGTSYVGIRDPNFDQIGRFSFQVQSPPTHLGWGATVDVEADGYEPAHARVLISAGEHELPGIAMTSLVLLPRLVVRGQFLGLDTGAKWTAIEASDFQLYARYLAGESIEPVLQQRAAVGFNLLRVFGMAHGMFHLYPQEHPNFYAQLPVFASLCERAGLRVELTVFADATKVMLDQAAQSRHWQQVGDALAGCRTVLVELVNEADQAINQINTAAFWPLAGLLCAHGSNGSEQRPVQPPWDYQTFHTNGAFEWPRKVGHNAMEIWAGPTIANENTRAPDRFNSPQQAFDAAAGGALLCAGSCFHSVRGKTSQLWDGLELDLARAWAAGAKSISLDCQDGAYSHRADLEGPNDLRVYQRGTCRAIIRK